MKPIVITLCFLVQFSFVNPQHAKLTRLPDSLSDEKKEFTDVFIKYFTSSFYTDDFMQAFADLREGKEIKDKKYPELLQFKPALQLTGKTCENFNYIFTDKIANAPFASTHKELSETKMDFEKNAAWVPEALGPSYIVREINNDKNSQFPAHFLYFYRAGIDTSDKYAFHVKVSYMHQKEKKGTSEIVIYAQKKE